MILFIIILIIIIIIIIIAIMKIYLFIHFIFISIFFLFVCGAGKGKSDRTHPFLGSGYQRLFMCDFSFFSARSFAKSYISKESFCLNLLYMHVYMLLYMHVYMLFLKPNKKLRDTFYYHFHHHHYHHHHRHHHYLFIHLFILFLFLFFTCLSVEQVRENPTERTPFWVLDTRDFSCVISVFSPLVALLSLTFQRRAFA